MEFTGIVSEIDIRFSVNGSESMALMKNGDITITAAGITETYSGRSKPNFVKDATGENLIEYSGHNADHRTDRSWSKVIYRKGAMGSPAHYHTVREEIYYAIQGVGKIIVDG